MKSHTHYLWFSTERRQEIIDITDQVEAQLARSGVQEGMALVSAMHITASVFVNDHESGLWQDILRWLEESVAPWDPRRYRHNETGEDNAAAHLRSLTIGHEVIVPVTAGKLDLGPWQRVGLHRPIPAAGQSPNTLMMTRRAGERLTSSRHPAALDSPGMGRGRDLGAPWCSRRPTCRRVCPT